MTPQAVRTTNRGIVSVHATVQDITDPASGMVETYALCNMLFYPPEADEEEPVFLETRESINCQQCARLVALVAIAKEYARGSISTDGYSKISADYHLWCDSVVPSSMLSESIGRGSVRVRVC